MAKFISIGIATLSELLLNNGTTATGWKCKIRILSLFDSYKIGDSNRTKWHKNGN